MHFNACSCQTTLQFIHALLYNTLSFKQELNLLVIVCLGVYFRLYAPLRGRNDTVFFIDLVFDLMPGRKTVPCWNVLNEMYICN